MSPQPSDLEVALFLQRKRHQLSEKHHWFIDDMASYTARGHELSLKQRQYLHSLFRRLGGKIYGTQQQINTIANDLEIVMFLLREGVRLSIREREFVDDVVRLFRRQLTPKQQRYLHGLFCKLGGRIT